MLSQSQIDSIIQRDLARHRVIADAWRRYESDWPDTLRPTQSDPTGSDNISVNITKVAVDTISSFLFGEGVDFTAGEDASAEDDWLDAFWAENDEDEFLTDLAVSGAVSGDAYVMLGGPDEGEYPSITLLDPQHVSVVTDPMNYRKATAFVISAQAQTPFASRTDDGTVRHQKIVEKQDDGTWIIYDAVKFPYSNQMIAQGEPVVWPYPWCPIFHTKNTPNPHSYFGLPDLGADMQKANRALNFALSNTNRIQKLHGHPHVWGKGIGQAETVDLSPDTINAFESDDAELNQLSPSDIQGHLDYVRLLKEFFHSIASVPEVATGKLDSVGQLSGLALKVLYGPLLRVVETKRKLYGSLLRDLSKRALEMAGYEGVSVTINWPSVLPSDEAEALDAAAKKRDLGVSVPTLLGELGYKAEDEAQKQAAYTVLTPTVPVPTAPAPLAVTQ